MQPYTDEQLDAWVDAAADCLAFDEQCERWDNPKFTFIEVDAEGAHFFVSDGFQLVGVLVRPDGQGVIEDRYTHRVGLAHDPKEDDYAYTSRGIAEAQAEASSNGTDHVYAVWDITDLYPQIVALAWHGETYTKR